MGSLGEHQKGKMPFLNHFHKLNEEFNQRNQDQWNSYLRYKRVMFKIGKWLMKKSKVEWTHVVTPE